MDTVRGFDGTLSDHVDDDCYAQTPDAPPAIGGDERRMHVRAYNHWVSLLQGRPYPSIHDLEPERIVDFGAHSVLLDFSKGLEDPTIPFLGAALRAECGVDADIKRVAEVPSRSLLSRLTDHYLQIIANRAPIGFEAEFVGQRGQNTMYRGILMPFSSNDETIDYIYGVINWKVLVDADTQARLDAELDEAMRGAQREPLTAPVWADGPSAGLDEVSTPDEADDTAPGVDHSVGLADHLTLARQSAAAARAADTRSRAALYRALGRAHDFALAADADLAGYAELLDDAGIVAQARAPMTPVAKLVFGADYDKTRLTEFATVLTHARRIGVPGGELAATLEATTGGIKAIVAAERAHRRPAPKPPSVPIRALRAMRDRPPLGRVEIAGDREFVLLLARQNGAGVYDIVATLEDDKLTQTALRRAG